ncbi:MAG: response regulator transcription factor [Methylophilaceae bacterium]
MANQITLLIADDHPLVREGMRMLLAREADFNLLGEASDGATALRLVGELKPQVVVLDLGLPVLDGLEVARQLRQQQSSSRLLALTARTDPVSVRSALTIGMDGYVTKSEDSKELLLAIRTLAAGGGYFSPSIAHLLEIDEPEIAIAITAREREILSGVAQGFSSKEIAARLGISVLTVQKHRENLGRKLGTRNAAEMAAYAINRGMNQRDK